MQSMFEHTEKQVTQRDDHDPLYPRPAHLEDRHSYARDT